ncbi:MAG TPA: ACP phosphodiesterase [Thermoanaerobaculia bacterium]|nr:ACP phosphodiesterase [Thermoanaerobaculia bacterium]
MNYLAHLFLAESTAESLIGNLAGDFVKGRLGDELRAGVRAGIVAHRKIDEFTDTHPAVGAFRRVVAAEHGHYARVICDVFFDHFLACDWNEYSSETLDDFLRRVFATLDPHVDEMPGHLRLVYPRMRDQGWLESYADVYGVAMALRGLSGRFSRPVRLEGAVHFLRDARGTLHAHFRQFFPEVVDYARRIQR